MNDNHENKDLFEDESKREPFAKKVARFSAFIYLGLAITVVITATVGIFSISYDYDSSLPQISLPEIDLTIPEVSIPFEESQREESTDYPVNNEQSGVTPDVSTPEPPRTMYYFPVEGEVIKNYSMDALVYCETMKDYRVHSGIDIASTVGAEVIAFTDGVVSAVSDDYFNGTTVVITHEQGVVSYYMNLDPTVGYVGTTARAEALDPSHLHFEIRVNGSNIDPLPELP